MKLWDPLAIERGWLWVGTDLSESTSVSEANMAAHAAGNRVRHAFSLDYITSSFRIYLDFLTTDRRAAETGAMYRKSVPPLASICSKRRKSEAVLESPPEAET